jgi:hypothetical protein
VATTDEDAIEFALTLERSYLAVVRGIRKIRVGRIVYLAFSGDGRQMGFAHPKEERDALLASDPLTFVRPHQRDLRYHWCEVRLDRIEIDELHELVLDAWGMVVPKRLFAARLAEADRRADEPAQRPGGIIRLTFSKKK